MSFAAFTPYTFLHPSFWNTDVMARALNTTLNYEDKDRTPGMAEQRARRSVISCRQPRAEMPCQHQTAHFQPIVEELNFYLQLCYLESL